MFFLLIQRLGERDVAVKVPLVKFVEQNCRHAAQLRVVNHLPQQNAFSYETNFGLRRSHVLKPDLVTDFLAEFHAQLGCDARGEQTRGEPAWLQNDHLARVEQSVLEQHLWHLRGFAGAGGRGQDEPLVFAQARDDFVLDVVNGQSVGHFERF
jgi:hypothetical protein